MEADVRYLVCLDGEEEEEDVAAVAVVVAVQDMVVAIKVIAVPESLAIMDLYLH